jgi:hypothetical protein
LQEVGAKSNFELRSVSIYELQISFFFTLTIKTQSGFDIIGKKTFMIAVFRPESGRRENRNRIGYVVIHNHTEILTDMYIDVSAPSLFEINEGAFSSFDGPLSLRFGVQHPIKGSFWLSNSSGNQGGTMAM